MRWDDWASLVLIALMSLGGKRGIEIGGGMGFFRALSLSLGWRVDWRDGGALVASCGFSAG